MQRTLLVLVFVAGAILFSSSARADIHLGAAVGRGNLEVDDFDADDSSTKVFGGFRILKLFGIEAQYVDFGSLDDSASGVDFEADVTSFDIFAVGTIPVWRLEFFGKAGIGYRDIESRRTGGTTSTDDDDGFDVAFGLGAAFQVSDRFLIRVEWETFEIDGAEDLTLGSFGFEFRF